MAATLREQLVGAWKLVSYVEVPTDGSDLFNRWAKSPKA